MYFIPKPNLLTQLMGSHSQNHNLTIPHMIPKSSLSKLPVPLSTYGSPDTSYHTIIIIRSATLKSVAPSSSPVLNHHDNSTVSQNKPIGCPEKGNCVTILLSILVCWSVSAYPPNPYKVRPWRFRA